MRDARAMNERVTVLQLVYDEDSDTYRWETAYPSWAVSELDTRSNLFSSVGIGARGVTFTMWKNPRLTLFRAIRWRGEFCFLTSIEPDADGLHATVKAAICDTVTCRADVDRAEPGCRFPGVLTEKYVKWDQPQLHGINETTFVLVTPKEVALVPGSLVSVGAVSYRVAVRHELDAWKNEYEITRTEDL